MKYLIWSHEHDAWWGEDELGYCKNIDLAGRYESARADDICVKANIALRPGQRPKEVCIPESAVMRKTDITHTVEEGIDSSGGGFEHAETDVVQAFYRAGNLISCAHAIFPARDKKTNEWFPVMLMFDQDQKRFSYAFGLEDENELGSLIQLLYGCWTLCRERNGKQEPPR